MTKPLGLPFHKYKHSCSGQSYYFMILCCYRILCIVVLFYFMLLFIYIFLLGGQRFRNKDFYLFFFTFSFSSKYSIHMEFHVTNLYSKICGSHPFLYVKTWFKGNFIKSARCEFLKFCDEESSLEISLFLKQLDI